MEHLLLLVKSTFPEAIWALKMSARAGFRFWGDLALEEVAPEINGFAFEDEAPDITPVGGLFGFD